MMVLNGVAAARSSVAVSAPSAPQGATFSYAVQALLSETHTPIVALVGLWRVSS